MKQDVGHSCVAWRGTTACDADKGVIDRPDDRPCTQQIPYDVGGYCECKDSRLQGGKVTVKEVFDCTVSDSDGVAVRDSFTCSEICSTPKVQRKLQV